MQMPVDLAGLPSLGMLSAAASAAAAVPAAAPTASTGAAHIQFEIDTVQPASFAASTDQRDEQSGAAPGQDVLKRRLDQLQKRVAAQPSSAGSHNAAGPVPVVQKKRRPVGSKSAAGKVAAGPGDGGGGDAAKLPPRPWSKEEIRKLKSLVVSDGAGLWQLKADQLGTGRSAKAVHTRWLRDTGRIIDLPRGHKNMLNDHMTSEDVNQQAAILDQSAYLLPMVSGSLGLAFAAQTKPA